MSLMPSSPVSSLLNLPPEMLVSIFCHLPAPAICSFRSCCSLLRTLSDHPRVWIARAKEDYGARLGAGSIPREVYQRLLHRYGRLRGLWQRTDLSPYGGVLKVFVRDAEICFDHLLPTSDINSPLQHRALLTISLNPTSCEPVITNKDAICEGLKPSIKVSGCLTKLEVVSRGRKSHHSPKDWIKLEEERRRVDTGIGQQESMEKMVLEYQQRSHQSFRPLPICPSPNQDDRKGTSLVPSLFLAVFPPHGTQLVQIRAYFGYTVGMKVTGDPVVGIDQELFRLEERLDIPVHHQRSTESLLEFGQLCSPFSHRVSPFVLPEDINTSQPVPWTSCKERWRCSTFGYSSRKESNFNHLVVFTEDDFALLLLADKKLILFKRVNPDQDFKQPEPS